MLTPIIMIAATLVSVSTWAQSPAATATGKLASGANITIKYSAPSVRGRKIYGTDLVPYDKVWRAGANEATTIDIDKDVTVKARSSRKESIASMLSQARKDNGRSSFNTQTGQWGINRDQSTTRDAAKDALVVKVTPKKSAMTEQLKYVVGSGGFSIIWENLGDSCFGEVILE
ncbi:MAG: DUF2911 domain-containing protein [Bacteroidota bacterium]